MMKYDYLLYPNMDMIVVSLSGVNCVFHIQSDHEICNEYQSTVIA